MHDLPHLFKAEFLVLPTTPYPVVLGMNSLQMQQAVFTAGPRPSLTLTAAGPNRERVPLSLPSPSVEHAAGTQQRAPLLLVASLTLKGYHEMLVKAVVPTEYVWGMNAKEGFINPTASDCAPLRVAHGITRLTTSGKTCVLVCNPSPETIVLPAGFKVASFSPASAPESPTLIAQPSPSSGQGEQDSKHFAAEEARTRSNSNRLPPVRMNSTLSTAQREQLSSLLASFADIFAESGARPPTPRLPPYAGQLQQDAQPIQEAARRRLNPMEAKQIQAEVQNMERTGIIRRSQSPWVSEIVLVRKKDGGLRFCVDFRRVNQTIVGDAWPMRRATDIVDSLQQPRWFSTLDLKNAFWSVPLEEDIKAITSFRTPGGLFEFNVLPFGLKVAPAAFQRAIDIALLGLPTAWPYMDDIWSLSNECRASSWAL
jgi:hypothetical protein